MGKILKHFIMPHPPIVVSEVGKGEEKRALSTVEACTKVADIIGSLQPDTIVIITPHGPVFRDAIAISDGNYISGDLSNFNAEEVQFNLKINNSLTEAIVKYAHGMGVFAVAINDESADNFEISYELDHGTMVPLYFVNKRLSNYKLVHITYGFLSEVDLYKFGIAIKQAVELSNENVVIIASGDLSHKVTEEAPYGYSPYGKEFDDKVLDLLKEGNVLNVFQMDKNLIECAGECGLRSFYIMLGTLDGYKFKGDILSYEAPFGIGYGVMSFDINESNDEDILHKIDEQKKQSIKEIRDKEDPYVRLARETLEHYVETGELTKVPNYVTEEMLKEKHGVFVSLKKDGDLRGCIGTTFPAYNSVAEEIIHNAIEAGERDPRFNPVDSDELESIIYSVDVLMPAEKAEKKDLDPKNYGVIVRSGIKSGLLLPDLSGVDTVDEQLEIALRKAGIGNHEHYTIERFKVIRHK